MYDCVKTIFWNNYTAVTPMKPINPTQYFMRSIVVVHLFLVDGIFLMLKAKAKTNINVKMKNP